MLTFLLAVAVLIMRVFPRTPCALWLHLHLVELPLAMLRRIERKHFIFLLVCLGAGSSLALALPAELALIAAWDLSIYFDAMAVAYLSALMTRARAAAAIVRTFLTRWMRPVRRAARARRPERRRPEAKAGNDDDGGDRANRLLPLAA